jgi:hypothetical protein
MKERTKMRPVIVESPYAGDVERNLRYLRAAMRDCILRGETPYASHALLTQPGVLDDDNPRERRLGIQAGFDLAESLGANAVRVVYTDLGESSGMTAGIEHAKQIGQQIVRRSLPAPEVER